MNNQLLTKHSLITVIRKTTLRIICLMLAASPALSNEADTCAQQNTFEAGVYGKFLYNGDEPRLYRICVERGRKRVAAFVRFDSDQLDFPKTEGEHVCLDIEGRNIEIVTRIQRKHRGTYTCLSCCEEKNR